ncbi:DinB superfamily protein [Chitinophaga sp. CF118]|uniref:DinB family protein n=1 Tax=Chitinophaga sp. CF118 TaxID=1884367 RepID=UPI0008E01397|nr:DinB family protein [Chitinophaga sp. CF118]SFD74956.1 DinB superfamily protein [Chitinophaga sp. CF118]
MESQLTNTPTLQLLPEFESIAAELFEVLSSFTEEDINTIPFEGSWTAGQVGEHIYKSASGISHSLQGEVKQTDRDPGQKIEAIRDVFLNFDLKFTSPEFIRPSELPHDKTLLLRCLKIIMEEIRQQAQTQDLTAICLQSVLPGFGDLTRLELNYFIIFHTQRHIHQLKKIKSYC